MNNRWFPNNNLSTKLMKILPICSQKKKYIEQMIHIREPIISVQEQRQTRQIISPTINCKSNYTDKCYAEYNINNLRRGFGQLKEIRYETMEPGKPSLVVHSSTLTKSENEIIISTNQVLNELAKMELRKRFSIVHTEKYIYVIGGYIYDYRVPIRRKPSHDYKYDVETKQFIPIQGLPNGAMGFGLCTEDDFIYTVGGNDINNKPLSDCYCLNIGNSNETWIKLPNLPAPTIGPGLGVHNGELHCIGGYDVLGNESIAHGEYLTLHYPRDKQWQYASELETIRARPLVFIIPDASSNRQNVYVAGGFNVNKHTHKPYIVPDLQLFNQTTQRWQYLTTIPNLELSHALSLNENKLNVSETIELPGQEPETNILRIFDLEKRIWMDTGNDADTRKMNKKNLTSINRSPDIQIKNIDPLEKPKTSTLQIPNSKSQHPHIKSGTDKARDIKQKMSMKTKRSNISTSKKPVDKKTQIKISK